MTKLVICRGLPASGKTTFSRTWVAQDPQKRVRANRDLLRQAVGGGNAKTKFDRAGEELVTKLQRSLVEESLKAGKDVVIDDTNLVARFVKDWLKLASKAGAEVEWHDEFLDVPLIELIQRNDAREDPVPKEVIVDMYNRYLSQGKRLQRPQIDSDEVATTKPYTGTPGKPKAFLVDLDGTIASNGPDREHPNRGYFDWSRVGEDLPVQPVIDIVRHFEAQGLQPVFVSGRDAVCRKETATWIYKHVGLDPYNRLHMRPEGDNRKDSIVKLEIFDNEIRDHYDVQFCIDDRDQVVKAYRSIGLTVLQVAEGSF